MVYTVQDLLPQPFSLERFTCQAHAAHSDNRTFSSSDGLQHVFDIQDIRIDVYDSYKPLYVCQAQSSDTWQF